MEYFLGSLVTLVIVYIVSSKLVNNNWQVPSVKYRQSHVYQLLLSSTPSSFSSTQKRVRQTQSRKAGLGRKEMKVVFYNDKAYWIADNTFFSADIVNGIIDQNSKKVVDTMGIDKVELDKLSIIVEKLTEEPINDNRNSGDEELF